MPAQEVKQELQSQTKTQGEERPQPFSPIQIPVDNTLSKTLVEVVLDDFDSARNSRESYDYGTNDKGEKLGFDKWIEDLKHLYSGWREAKEIPWRFCSNRSVKIAASILEMVVARMFSAVWNEDLTRWRPGEITDTPKVERISKFMDWWIKVQSPMRDFFDDWVKVTSGFGDSWTELSWVVEERDAGPEPTPKMDPMTGQQAIDPMTGQPAMTLGRKIDRDERTHAIILPKEAVYTMKDSKDAENDPICIEEEFPYRKLEEMERAGQLVNVTTELSKLIHVNVPNTGIPDEELERIKAVKRRNVPVKIVRWYGHFDVDGTGFPQSVRIWIAKDFRLYLGGVRMSDITKSGRRPLVFERYNTYIDRIDHLFGQGILDQVRELAKEVDAIFNQITDGNTLSILRPGFYDPSGDVDAGAIKLAPNKMIPVTDPNHNVMFPNIEINTDRLINAIRLVMEYIERLTAASSYVMGRESEIVGGSGTATRTNAIMQSAEIRFARPAERLRAGAAKILTRLFDIIQLNIPPGLEGRVLGEDGQPIFKAGEISEEGLAGRYDAYLLDDPTMGSKETERQVTSMMYSLLMQNMIVGTDPVKIYGVTAKLLKSVGWDPEEILGPEPSMDDIDEPDDENTLMIQGDFKRVKANIYENHLFHIQKHMEMMQSPTLQMLGQTNPILVQQIMQYNQNHIMEHQMMMQQMMQLMSKQQGAKSGEAGKSDKGGEQANPFTDPNGGVENTGGPMGQAMQDKRDGTAQSSASA